MSDVIDNSNVSSIEKYDNRIRVSNYDLTRFGNERFLDLCGENPEYPERNSNYWEWLRVSWLQSNWFRASSEVTAHCK